MITNEYLAEVCTPVLVRDWLKKQPKKRIFYMYDGVECVMGTYMRDTLNMKDIGVGCGTLFHHGRYGNYEMPSWAKEYELQLMKKSNRTGCILGPVSALNTLQSYLEIAA